MVLPQAAGLSDEEIVAAVLAGQRDAFALLFERHNSALVRYLTVQTNDSALADDLAQDAFFEAYRCLNQLAVGRLFALWLYRIAQHRLHRSWRRERTHHVLSIDEVAVAIERITPALDQPIDPFTSCGDRELIQQVLAELTQWQREVLLLHDECGFTAPEIAAATGCAVAAVERQVSRTRTRFRTRYQALADHAP